MNAEKVSDFCKQISFIIETGIPLDDGIDAMMDEASSIAEREMLHNIKGDILRGVSLGTAMENTGLFPDYAVRMSNVGHRTGNMDVVMQSLAQYYDNERTLAKTLRDAVVYPVTMILVLLTVLFVLITKVLPVFDQVYIQLGAQSNPAINKAINLGGAVILGLIIFFAILMVIFLLFQVRGRKRGNQWAEGFLHLLQQHTKVGRLIAGRRLASVMSLAISSGMDIGTGMEYASEVMGDKKLTEEIAQAKNKIDEGEGLHNVLNNMGIYKAMELRMIRVGSRTGKMDSAFEYLSDRYEGYVDEAIAKAVGRVEPILVVTMTITVGLILLSVMVPLIEIMASIG